MKILFFWIGNELPEERKSAIASTMALYPEAQYFCITDQKYFVSPKIGCIDPQSIIDDMMRYFGFKVMPGQWKSPVILSDWARFFYLSVNPNALYLDTDCRMVKRFDFEGQANCLHAESDYYLIYSPKAGVDFRPMMKNQAPGLLVGMAAKITWWKPLSGLYYKHREV